jgi:hypothetical protein
VFNLSSVIKSPARKRYAKIPAGSMALCRGEMKTGVKGKLGEHTGAKKLFNACN